MIKHAVIAGIEEGSLASELGLAKGDRILKINGQTPLDLIDFQMFWADEEIDLLIEKGQSGKKLLFSIEKEIDDALGVVFETAVFNQIRNCANQCKFCFVEQMAPNMRETLYTKDDDYRLSFLQGNFITLTNLGKKDFARIKRLHLSPLYVSVHTTDPGLRVDLLGNKNAGKIIEQLTELAQSGIQIHAQVVLCKNINDGHYLEKTITELANLYPAVSSLAIVPVGITKFRNNTEDFPEFSLFEARKLIQNISKKQASFREKLNNSFVFLSDEFYVKADYPFPEAKIYEGFVQIENGVGISRVFLDEFEALKKTLPRQVEPIHYYLVSGVLGGQVLRPVLEYLSKIEGLRITHKILENRFFGPRVTVTGLLTGSDLLLGLKDLTPGAKVIIPEILLKRGEDLFLDNLTLDQVQDSLNLEIIVCQTRAEGLVKALFGLEIEE